jgi:hypothetical protein
LQGLNYQRGESPGGSWGAPPENFQILHLAGQDFQHILKRISLEIAVFLDISSNLPEFPSDFLN